MEFRSLLITSISFTAAAAAAWGIAVAGVRGNSGWMPLDRGAAVTLAVAAVMLWLSLFLLRYVLAYVNGLRAEYRRREAALIRLADRKPPTVPLPLI